MRSRVTSLMLLCGLLLLQMAQADVINDVLKNDGSRLNMEWVVIAAQEASWPMLPPPDLSLGGAFQFDPGKYKLPASFEIMRTEVSCVQFLDSKQLSATRKQQITDLCEFAMHEPVTGVSFEEARDYCTMIGGKLPSEGQWVLAAILGSESWLQSYGVINKARSSREPKRFAAYKQDVEDADLSPGQLNGILANVWEITLSTWQGQRNVFVMKGGSFDLADKPHLLHPYYRAAFNGNDIYNKNIGFRCVREPGNN